MHYLKGTCKEPERYLHQKEPLKTLSITFAGEASWGPAKVVHFEHSSCLQSVTIHIPTNSYQDHIALVHKIFQTNFKIKSLQVPLMWATKLFLYEADSNIRYLSVTSGNLDIEDL